MTVLHVDFEKRSTVDLKKAGLHNYSTHPTTDVWCMAYAFDDEPVRLWTPHIAEDESFKRFWNAVYHERAHDGFQIIAHNAHFEMAIWKEVMVPRYGFPVPDSDAVWHCTMAMAYAMGLPGALD